MKTQKNYAPHLILFILLIAILSSCSSECRCPNKRRYVFQEKDTVQYFFLNNQIVMKDNSYSIN